jgi:hypothetical protein
MKRSTVLCAVLVVCCSCFAQGSVAQQAATGAKLTNVSLVLGPISPAVISSEKSASRTVHHTDLLSSVVPPVVPIIDQEILSKIPRQVFDAQGQPGDVVNLLILGDRHDVRKAIGSAGWSRIACTKLGAVWHDFWGALDIRSYRGVPMSKLYMFGRHQDVGYANSKMPFSWWGRHHFRIWQAPFQVDGETLWIGAATHDVGLHWGNRHFVHRIDPNVDAERQYVSHSLVSTGRVEVVGYVNESDGPVQARTTTGETFYTDGRALVLRVVGKNSARMAQTTQLP